MPRGTAYHGFSERNYVKSRGKNSGAPSLFLEKNSQTLPQRNHHNWGGEEPLLENPIEVCTYAHLVKEGGGKFGRRHP